MSLEQATLEYIHYCDSLMLTNVLNLSLNPRMPFLKYKSDLGWFIWPDDQHDQEMTNMTMTWTGWLVQAATLFEITPRLIDDVGYRFGYNYFG